MILGTIGFENSVPFKKSRWPGVDEREHRISLGREAAAALIVDGRLAAAAAEERFNHKKAFWRFPDRRYSILRAAAGVKSSDVDKIAHGFDDRQYQAIYSIDPTTAEQYEAVVSREVLLEKLDPELPSFPADRFCPVNHRLAHAAHGITCRNIGVDFSSEDVEPLAVQTVTEHSAPWSDSVVALRQGER